MYDDWTTGNLKGLIWGKKNITTMLFHRKDVYNLHRKIA